MIEKQPRREFLKLMAASGLLATGCQSLGRIAGSTTSVAQAPEPAPLPVSAAAAGAGVGWYWNPDSLKHTLFGHRESALRTQAILETLGADAVSKNLVLAVGRIADETELARAHSPRYIREVKEWNSSRLYFRKDRWSPYGSPYVYRAAAAAAGATVDLFRSINNGQMRAGFATVRPPGHHATFDQPFGYCVFNNIAVGIKSLQTESPAIRVAVVDIDAHHGNGIQDLFYLDPQVLYISTHQHEWPYSGKIDETGSGPGLGKNMNIPLPPQVSDEGYKKILETLIQPALRRFRPEILIVANGFDAHWRDPQSNLALSLRGHADLCSGLVESAREICHGRIAFVLEGGYDLQVLQSGVGNTFRVLLGENEVSDPYGVSPQREPDLRSLIATVKRIQKL